MDDISLSDFFARIAENLPSEEELAAQALSRLQANKAPFEAPDSKAFIGTSLKAWLEVVAAAGVPVIGAQPIATVHRNAVLGYESSPEAWNAVTPLLAALPQTHMARWDACASLDLKHAMAHQLPYGAHARSLEPSDPRAYDILTEYPADEFVVWSRPWVQARMVDGYPLEFRVFVQANKVIGIASYYPQRALPDTAEMQALAQRCGELTEQVLAQLNASGRYPWLRAYEGRFEQGSVNATLDFLVTPDNQVLFLEAGPPYGAGAHPCAFIDRPIEGIALALAPGVIAR